MAFRRPSLALDTAFCGSCGSPAPRSISLIDGKVPSLSSWPPVRSGPIEERSKSRQIAPIDINDGGLYLGRALRAFKSQCWLIEWIERLYRRRGSQIDAVDQIVVLQSRARADIRYMGHRVVVCIADQRRTRAPAGSMPLNRPNCRGKRLMLMKGVQTDGRHFAGSADE